jgi:transcriptional regulator with XRE-family HTH domain
MFMGESIHSKEYREIIQRLRDVRLTTKLTQTEVARKLNKPQSYVSKIERGERRIDVVELKRILKIYKVALADFF